MRLLTRRLAGLGLQAGDAVCRRAVTGQQIAVAEGFQPFQVAALTLQRLRQQPAAAPLQYFDRLLRPAEPGQGIGGVRRQALGFLQP